MTADDTYEEPQQATDKKSKFDLNEPEEINEEVQDEIVEQEVEEEEPVEEIKSEPARKRKPRKE